MTEAAAQLHHGTPGADPRRLAFLLQRLVDRLATGVVALDERGRVLHASEVFWPAPASGGGAAECGTLRRPLPPRLQARVMEELAGMDAAETRVFHLGWDIGGNGPLPYRIVAAAAEGLGPRGGRLTLLAFQGPEGAGRRESRAARATRNATANACPDEDRGLSRAELPVSIDALLADLLVGLRPDRLRAAGVEVDLELSPGLPPVPGSRTRLRRMLNHAARAGLESMPAGGALSIRARQVGASGPGARVRLLIRDTGRGYDADTITRILRTTVEPRLSRAERRLRSVRATARAQGGTMHLVSAPQRGTSVVIDLPLAREAARGRAQPPGAGTPARPLERAAA
jgi:hypothetical protein